MAEIFTPWILAGFTVAFLIGSAAYNRRTGYRKVRPAMSGVDELLVWLAGFHSVPAQETAPPPLSAEEQTEELLRLNAALGKTEIPQPEHETVAAGR